MIVKDSPTKIEFCVPINADQTEDIIVIDEIVKLISKDEQTDTITKFGHINSHHGPMQSCHPEYKGSQCNETYELDNDLAYCNIIRAYHQEDNLSHSILTSDLE